MTTGSHRHQLGLPRLIMVLFSIPGFELGFTSVNHSEDLEVSPVRPGEEFDVAAVDSFVRKGIPGLEGAIEVLQFPGGHANLTYLLRFTNRELVLRRPPFGPVGPGAHDMAREFRVLSHLWNYFDRAPRAYLLCEDQNLIGATFFIMEKREGVVIRNEIPLEMRHHPKVERRLSFALVDALVDFHSVNYKKAGLEDLGKPRGFVERQLRGWYKRWKLAMDRELPEIDRMYEWLVRTQPKSRQPTLVHNDFKLDNCLVSPADPDRITSILDWDMATIGDPLVDLGTLLAYWIDAEVSQEAVVTLMQNSGFPKSREIAEHYSSKTGVELSTIAWYTVFGLWKTSIVVQQIYIRFARGQTQDSRFRHFNQRIPELLELGWKMSRQFESDPAN